MIARLAPLAGLVMMMSAPAAWAAGSCSTGRLQCEAACTADHVARYYSGSSDRCQSSCVPRWNQCLRSGIWVDLEHRTTGTWEEASPF